jgi:hypothetical protein
MKQTTVHRFKILLLGTLLSSSVCVQGAQKRIEHAKASCALASLSDQKSGSVDRKTKSSACATGRQEKNYPCDYISPRGLLCTRSFKRSDEKTRHGNESHYQIKSYCCATCPRRFKRKEHRDAHLKTHRQVDVPYGPDLLTPPSLSSLENFASSSPLGNDPEHGPHPHDLECGSQPDPYETETTSPSDKDPHETPREILSPFLPGQPFSYRPQTGGTLFFEELVSLLIGVEKK